MRDMTVDPGLNSGYGLWDNWKLFHSDVFRTRKKATEEQLTDLFDQFRDLLVTYKPDAVTLEGVQDFRNLRSDVASARGNLMKLSYIVGGYYALCSTRAIHCEIVLPSAWKGQLPDTALDLRVRRVLKRGFKKHELQAVGLGLHIQGTL